LQPIFMTNSGPFSWPDALFGHRKPWNWDNKWTLRELWALVRRWSDWIYFSSVFSDRGFVRLIGAVDFDQEIARESRYAVKVSFIS
jgi:hypothetical protein